MGLKIPVSGVRFPPRPPHSKRRSEGAGQNFRLCSKLALLALLIAASATAFAGEKMTQTIPAGSVVELPEIKWFVLSPEQLELAKANALKQDVPIEVKRGKRTIHGFTRHLPDGSKEIYTVSPERVDDEVATTLGHEIMHAVIGHYHD